MSPAAEPPAGLPPKADSAGTPWQGRHFDNNSFAGDDGTAPAVLVDALARFRRRGDTAAVVVDAFRTSRLLIPLVAELGASGHNDAGVLVDKSQELSIVTVAGPDGRAVLPVFSSVDAMQRWNPRARPVPADGERVALAAVDEGTELVVLDPISPDEFVIRRPALWAIAQRMPWLPSPLDPEVFEAFSDSIRSELGVLDIALTAGDPFGRLEGPELAVRLELTVGLTNDELDAILARLAQRWAASDMISQRVDSLAVRLTSAG
jgi:SseB protein N-terminal domain